MFSPGTLWEQVVAVTDRALEQGALLSIPTDATLVPEGDVSFLVRVVSNLARKDEDRRRRAGMGDPTAGAGPGAAARPNPFLPYDEELYVADVGPDHVAVLNKFNVVEHHLLVVTRAFEHQERLLDAGDFEALWRCLREVDGLGFYNGGVIAGASQPHKHLQLVPLPLHGRGPAVPLEPAFGDAGAGGEPGRSSRLSFPHAVVRLEPGFESDPVDAGVQTAALYREMLSRVGRQVREGDHGGTTDPYNLLLTRRWMLLVPRVRECFHGVSFNSLAFAGALLVRSDQQLDVLRRRGCLAALAHVTTE